MQLTFLEAKVPLTKGYEQKPDGSYVGGSYPGVTNFTSHIEQVDSPQTLESVLKKHSELGNCLLTNSLVKQIVGESRAKLSDKEEERQWLVLDVDGIENILGAEDFIVQCLPEQFHDTSYVMQHSPSSGIKDGIRIHIFFLLHDQVDVGSVSAWLKYTNLETQLLSDQITLSKNCMALSLKLDWVANNNGRIIYITPPECKNFSDPVTNRIELTEKKYDTVSFNFAAIGTSQMRAKYKNKLNELRGAAGLKVSRKDEFYVIRGDHEYVHDSLVEAARITSPEADNDHFMRCNLDGGDSYAYYYHRGNPVYLYNFKGEPAVKMAILDPEYFNRVAKPDMEKLREKENRAFVFRDHITDKFFAGVRKEDGIVVQPAPIGSMQKIEDYFLEHGNTAPPAPIQSWDRMFDPTSDAQWRPDVKMFNTWRPTEYQNAMYKSLPPTTITKIIAHVTGNDGEVYEHFINWLAYIFQNRTKSGTAWVLHGVPGTGKGLLFHNIIRPLFGNDYCALKQIKDLKDQFNGWMEHSIFVNIDEANSDDTYSDSRTIVNSLKNWITEPVISVRQMQATAANRNSFVNFIFTTNDFGILPIQDGDRRFNVAPRQERIINITADEVENIANELSHFAGYLAHYEVDEARVRKPLENEAKASLKIAAESSLDTFYRACREGDLQYFTEGTHEISSEHDSMSQFRMAVDQWIDDLKKDRTSEVSITQLKHAHIVLCRDKGMKTNAFRSMCAKRGFPPEYVRGTKEARWTGWDIKWTANDAMKRDLKVHIKPVKTPEDVTHEVRS